ncbi:MAG: DUF1743 domain-containing protein [Candidatus Heimdallarchaeota archaeon]|nr:DUF1743 domain-containing protein [Candidatus Heimdallarchaeota archaeon]
MFKEQNSVQKKWHLGIDDTDSQSGMCTTYLATQIVEFLILNDVKLLDFPKLIRLNPNIPYKTRGNGAISITFSAPENKINLLWNEFVRLTEELSDIQDKNTDPGLVLIKGDIPNSILNLYQRALFQVIPLDEVKRLLAEYESIRTHTVKSGRGLIGATSAIAANLINDYTYELIAYRDPKNNSHRLIDEPSVIEADQKNPLSFNNYDYEHKQVMIIPHGPDPVICGIRGETTSAIIKVWEEIKVAQTVKNVMIFRSNQHTQVHFPKEFSIEEIEPYTSVKVRGKVISEPKDFPGGHVIFSIESLNKRIAVAAYEPTKRFRKIIRELKESDEVLVMGGVRPESSEHPMTINLEEIQILQLSPQYKKITPKCPSCASSLTSSGKNQGFKCRKCSYSTSKKEYINTPIGRKIRCGIRYVIPICAQRHLTKPVSRDPALQFHIAEAIDFEQAFDSFLKRRPFITKA